MLMCDNCGHPIKESENVLVFETGVAMYSEKGGHIYFIQDEDSISHRHCFWPPIERRLRYPDQQEIDNCALCYGPIKSHTRMIRTKVGLFHEGDIMEMHKDFQENYFHPNCIQQYVPDEWMNWSIADEYDRPPK
jgi:hypothetical protein